MGVMSDRDIRKALDEGHITIAPFEDKLLAPASLDFRLGHAFCHVWLASEASALDFARPIEEQLAFRIWTSSWHRLDPGACVLALSHEHFGFNESTAGQILCKSGIGRLFLTNTSDAGWYDPGFRGHAVIELKNQNTYPVMLRAGMKIGQMRFYRLDSPAERPYAGHFQDQEDFAIAGWFRSLGRLMEHAA